MSNLQNIILEAAEFGEPITSETIGTVQENKEYVPTIDVSTFSNFIVFSDETGDIGLKAIDQNYPCFAMNFCILKKDDYLEFSKKLKDLKISYFNSDLFIFHDVEISQKFRKRSRYAYNHNRSQQLLSQMNDDQFLNFIEDFSNLLKKTPFKQVTAVIDKRSVKVDRNNPRTLKSKQEELYKQTLLNGLTGVFNYLRSQGEQNKKTCIVFEESGDKESTTIKAIFYDFCSNISASTKENANLEYEVAPKKSNNEGLQLADMTAKAAVNIYLSERTSDRTCEIIKNKIISHDNEFFNYGLFKVTL